MTDRENYISIIRRTGFDYIPAGFNWCPSLNERFGGKLEEMKRTGQCRWESVEYIADKQLRGGERAQYLKYYEDLQEGADIDVYGVAHEKGSAAAMHMTRMRHPLQNASSVAEMEKYPFPHYVEDAGYEKLCAERNAKLKAADRILTGSMQCTIWECAWYMRGMMELMGDMMDEAPEADYILDRVTELSIERAEFYARTGADIIYLGDDVGMQKSIMMSLELYRKYLKPRLRRVIDAARRINPNIIFFYHSCGFVEPFIRDFIDVGIDVLNPVQPECMDFVQICRQYGQDISFHGAIGTQSTMPYATPEGIRAEVFRCLDAEGARGGLLVAPTHMLEPEVPWENIEAYITACREYVGR